MMKRCILLHITMICAVLVSSPLFALQPGDTLQMMKEELGEPLGKVQQGDTTTWFFPGGSVDVQNGIVHRLDENMEEKAEERAEQRAFIRKQHAKGLELYQGSWLSKKEIENLKKAEMISRHSARKTTTFSVWNRASQQSVDPPTRRNGIIQQKMTFSDQAKKSVKPQFTKTSCTTATPLSSFDQAGKGSTIQNPSRCNQKQHVSPVKKPD